MRRVLYRRLLITLLAVTALGGLASVALAEGGNDGAAIVWVVDVSGSMAQADPERLWSDAVALGAELAPDGSRIAYFAINDSIVSQTPFLDVSLADNRGVIGQAVEKTKCEGNTDFNIGLNAALDLLDETDAADKRLFFIGDISEGGFVLSDNDYGRAASELGTIAQRAVNSDVTIHFLFLEKAHSRAEFVPMWEALALQTGGGVTHTEPVTLAKTVETVYFTEFAYNSSITTGINTASVAQDFSIGLPTFGFSRLRIYISADSPLQGIQASGSGARLSYGQGRSYAMIELTQPYPEAVDLRLSPSENKDVRVYLLADGQASVVASSESRPELLTQEDGADAYRQQTTVTLAAAINGAPLFAGNAPQDAEITLLMTDPEGKSTSITDFFGKDGAFTFVFYPESYGNYTFALRAGSHGVEFAAGTPISIPIIELPIAEARPDYSVWMAATVGGVIILAACMFAFRRKHKASAYPVLTTVADNRGEPENTYGPFIGKLDIYGICIEGGKVDIPATSSQLAQFEGKKWTKLSTVMERAGVPYRYPAAEDIRLLPRADGALIVKNHSNALVYVGGRPHNKGEQAALVFGQKMYIVFEEDVNEFEIYYHNTVEMAGSGRRLRMELAK
ncbi:MAG: VWA domain-containing protein [Peptococcaceae bacterium]|jgi:hypothetical protein|nr:VWA domain-containing protein [Peptococcaceae bacterium]